MEVENLQSYLNWFIYLHRCKRDSEKWTKSNRILRHLVLERVRFKRKYALCQPHDCRLAENLLQNIYLLIIN